MHRGKQKPLHFSTQARPYLRSYELKAHPLCSSKMLMKEWLHLRDQMRSKQDLHRLALAHPEHSYDTLFAMFEQLFQRQISRNFYLLRQHGYEFVRLFKRGETTLIEIAHRHNLTPVMVARRVLEIVLFNNNNNNNNHNKATNNNSDKNNDHSRHHHQPSRLDKRKITKYLRDPSTIPSQPLRNQVIQCIHADDLFGPNIDRTRAVLGLEYESLLLDHVSALGLEYETEHDLRQRSSFKTPDVLLRVPVAFHDKVVCWIDSKAKFADEYTLKKDYSDSVSSYVGRFGPGMVVYWFGFVSDCVDCPMLQDDGILVVDAFPHTSHTVMLPGSQLPSSASTGQCIVTKGVG